MVTYDGGPRAGAKEAPSEVGPYDVLPDSDKMRSVGPEARITRRHEGPSEVGPWTNCHRALACKN